MAIEWFPRKPIDRPHTRIKSDSSALTGSSSGSQKQVMLVGSAEGGKPNTVYRVRNLYQAQQIFKNGELLDAMELAWNPTNTGLGAGDILAMRVEDATHATLTQDDITFNSRLYGNQANDIELELVTNSMSGNDSRNFIVRYAPDGYEEVYRNIGHIFTIEKDTDANTVPDYVGYRIADGLITIFTGDTADTADEISFTLGTGSNKFSNQLISNINSIEGVKATAPGSARNKNINTSGLDPQIKHEVAEGGSKVTGLLADIEHQLEFNDYVEVTIPEAYIDAENSIEDELIILGGAEITDFEPTNLSGGTTGPIPETWADKFAEFANEGGYYLVPLTDKQAVHAEAGAFVNERSYEGEPMRAIVGAGYDESVEQLTLRASAIRNARTLLVGFSGRITPLDGRTIKTPAYLHAAQVAGLASGLGIGESITFKPIKLSELSRTFSSVQKDALNMGGVVMAEFVRDRQVTKFRIVDDVTTFNDPSDPVANQMAVGESNDFLSSELKVMLDENYIGTKVINVSSSLIKNSVQSFLDQKKRDNEIQDYDPEDVQVVIDGEVAHISLVIYPIRSLKKIEVSLVYKQQVLDSSNA